MTKINKKRVEEFIRVDHAGERGAVKIKKSHNLAQQINQLELQ